MKKENKTKEVVKPTTYLKSEHDFYIGILRKGCKAGASDRQTIFDLYKKYIDPLHLHYQDSSCSSCASSILNIWNKLKEFMDRNGNLFVN